MKALEGVKIVDFTQGHSGSVATMILSDFGAEVIKIERPNATDPARNWAPLQNGHSAYFTYLNRGKKSLVVDYSTKEGRDIVLALVKDATVVVQNLPVGEMESYGLDYEALKAVNPEVIYASLSPFGQTGPLKHKAADDLTLQAISGMMDRTGFQDSPPTRVGFRVVNHMAAAYLAMSINLALVYKKRTGKGQIIDLAELDCMFAMMETGPWVYSITGEILPRTGNSYPSISPYDTLRAKDGFVSVGISTDRQWQKFCAVLNFEDLAKNPLYMTNESRGDNYESGLKQELEANMQTMGKFEIEARLQEAKLPCASVYTVAEAMATEHTAVHEMLVEVEDKGAGKVTIPGTIIKMLGTPGSVAGGAPLLGEHTKAYMTQLGYSENEIQALANANIVALA